VLSETTINKQRFAIIISIFVALRLVFIQRQLTIKAIFVNKVVIIKTHCTLLNE